MQTGAITSYFDVAQITLYAFWIFFAGLIIYLRREDRREGYPMLMEDGSIDSSAGVPSPKAFLLAHGETRYAPHVEPIEDIKAVPGANWPGAPLVPTGNPLVDGIGPAAYANRADEPDMTFDEGLPKIVPLRAAADFFLAWEDPDPRGFTVVGCDGVAAGSVADAWIDRSEVVIRYLEVELSGVAGEGRVLLPMNLSQLKSGLREVRVDSITAEQFAQVPRVRTADVVTLLEEDKIMAYYGGGKLYAMASRAEPLL